MIHKVTLIYSSCSTIYSAFEKAINFASVNQVPVEINFNGTILKIKSDSNIQEKVQEYFEKRKAEILA